MSGLKKRLASKTLSIGSWIQFGYPQTTEIMAKAGFDFMVVDMEHTSIASHELFQSIQICSLAGLSVLVRVGAHDPLLVKRAMDAGADGIIMPMVETRDQAEMARDAVYYPPVGKRGVGLARAQGYGLDFDDYMRRLRDEMIVIVMIEHHKAVAELESILAVDGVDGFFLGPYDMSASLGKPGQFNDPEVAAVLSRVGAIAKDHPKPSGIHVVHPDPTLLAKRIEESYKFIAYGTDMVFFSRMIRDSMQAIAPNFQRN
ncbi:aldolase/citrate lyase family protein [soil metagenome]